MHAPPLLFDLDGTLLDTIGDLAASLHAVRDALRLPRVDHDFVRRGIGHGLDALLRHGLADLEGVDLEREEDLAPLRERWCTHYAENVCVHTRAFDGVEELVSVLVARRYPLAIVSNKPETFCCQLIQRFGWQDAFDVVLGGNSLATRKPDPAPVLRACESLGVDVEDSWMIGDSPADITAGTRAGCARRVACTWGYRSMAELQKSAPSDAFERVEDLAAAILRS